MRESCITLYSTFAVKAGVKKSGKTWSPNTIQPTVHPQTPPNTINQPQPKSITVRLWFSVVRTHIVRNLQVSHYEVCSALS